MPTEEDMPLGALSAACSADELLEGSSVEATGLSAEDSAWLVLPVAERKLFAARRVAACTGRAAAEPWPWQQLLPNRSDSICSHMRVLVYSHALVAFSNASMPRHAPFALPGGFGFGAVETNHVWSDGDKPRHKQRMNNTYKMTPVIFALLSPC